MSLRGPVAITGGTGLMGRGLVTALAEAGRPVRLLTRAAASGPEERSGVQPVRWDGLEPPPEAIAGTSAVVHLSGEPIFGGLPTPARRRRMVSSRVDATRRIVESIADLPQPSRPRTLVCASAVGFYGDGGDAFLTEDAPRGEGFLADLCVAWEAAAQGAAQLGLRVVSLRFGVVLGAGGGALAMMRPIFRAGLGGRLGSGRQWFPWVHVDDARALVLHALDADDLMGPVNVVSPEPVRNADFTRALGGALGRPTPMAVPAFAIRAALGDLAGEFLASRRLQPAAAEASGFKFATKDLALALTKALREPAG